MLRIMTKNLHYCHTFCEKADHRQRLYPFPRIVTVIVRVYKCMNRWLSRGTFWESLLETDCAELWLKL